MKWAIVSLSIVAAACSGQELRSPTAPALLSDGAPGVSQTQAKGGTQLPFRGSVTTMTDAPPPLAHVTLDGTATHLGQFSGVLTAVVDLETSTATGTFEFTAANGDQLSGTFVGEGVFIPPNTARLTEVATVTSGTGRFADASGTFTMVRFNTIDFAAPGTGTFDGHLNLNR